MTRLTPARAAAGSLIALVCLLLAAARHGRGPGESASGRPLVVLCAAALRPPVEPVARDYEAVTGRRVELRFGASDDLLRQAISANDTSPVDLFLPADNSYIRTAQHRGIVGESTPLAEMRIVLLLAPNNPKRIRTWDDLTHPGLRVAVPSVAAAAGKLARDYLAERGLWRGIAANVVDSGTVTQAANAAKLGAADAAVVWDAVAAQYPGQDALPLPELAPVTARVEVAVLTSSGEGGEAARFVRFLSAPDQGLTRFREAGFRVGPKGRP